MKCSLTGICGFGLVLSALAVDPVVSDVSMTWTASSREATISYQLANAPAIVTLEILDGSGNSIDGALVGSSVVGDAYKQVETDGAHTITWHPFTGSFALPAAGVSARVTAYPVSDPPDYMVVSCALAGPDRVRYYPSEAYLPGGLHSNRQYKSTKIVMRKIVAKNVEWQMGSGATERALMPSYNTWQQPVNESNHVVRLDHDYYMAVFETTHGQYLSMTQGGLPPNQDNNNFWIEWFDRPVEQAYYSSIRGAVHWPTEPTSGSPIGKLRATTGLAFDLPSEAEWEYACRAGHGDGEWNDGTPFALHQHYTKINNTTGVTHYNGFQYSDATMPARCAISGGCWAAPGSDQCWRVEAATTGPTNGTAVVGMLGRPNSWGLYDMHGNVHEICLDWYKADITGLAGAVCTDSTSGNKVARGGSFYSYGATYCRSAARASSSATSQYVYDGYGFRLCCRIGAE